MYRGRKLSWKQVGCNQRKLQVNQVKQEMSTGNSLGGSLVAIKEIYTSQPLQVKKEMSIENSLGSRLDAIKENYKSTK